MATLPGTALALIHTGEAPTRSALTAKLGGTRATTGAITGELRDLRLIEVEASPGGGHLGRPSHRLLPDPNGPVALAAEIHTDGFTVALIQSWLCVRYVGLRVGSRPPVCAIV